mmetsp:Transcript_150281/g.482961  ORF Transcript_150281/g.482961 Transcript_150281/m.482961 type:complete len:182 (+) Transcript_150281:266-811(+)
MKAKLVGGSQGCSKKRTAAAAKKRPAVAQTQVSRKRPAAVHKYVSNGRLAAAGAVAWPAAALPNQLPSACLQKILEYAHMGAVDSIAMNLYVDGSLFEHFDAELEYSKVPKELRGRVLDNGRILLCSGQLPLINRAKGVIKSLGMTKEDLESLPPESLFLFREKGNTLHATSLNLTNFSNT